MSYALITGGSKGIGKAIAKNLAARKLNVLLVARNENELQQLAAEIQNFYGVKAFYLAIDLSLAGAVQQVFNWVVDNKYDVSILINNAGYGLNGPFEKYSIDEHTAMMQVNMNVPMELTYLLLPQLKKQPAAYIMNIASSAAYQAVPGLTAYAATKSFILSFSRGLNYELRNTCVSVTVVSPGATDTNFANRAQVTSLKAQKLAAKFNMTPEDVAAIGLDGMFAKKTEVITGLVNKVSALLVWLLPKKVLEKGAADIYGF